MLLFMCDYAVDYAPIMPVYACVYAPNYANYAKLCELCPNYARQLARGGGAAGPQLAQMSLLQPRLQDREYEQEYFAEQARERARKSLEWQRSQPKIQKKKR